MNTLSLKKSSISLEENRLIGIVEVQAISKKASDKTSGQEIAPEDMFNRLDDVLGENIEIWSYVSKIVAVSKGVGLNKIEEIRDEGLEG